jgi:hypothetical protein
MSTFDQRQDSFEKKFVHDADLQFKVAARRNKLLGLWAAGLMGLTGTAADEYAKSVVVADLAVAGDEDVFAKIRGDFDAKNVEQSDHQLRRTMDEFFAEAKLQIQNEG